MERGFYTTALTCILILISACAYEPGKSFSNGDGEYIGEAVCRHKAIITAVVAAEAGYKTTMFSGPTSDPGEGHIQTMALIDDKWQWICIDDDFIVFTCKQDDWFTPEKEFDSWGFSKQFIDKIDAVNDTLKGE